MAAALPFHDRHDFLHEHEGRPQVDLEQPRERGGVQIEGPRDADPGPVEQEVDPAAVPEDVLDHRADGGDVGHVGGVDAGNRFAFERVRPDEFFLRGFKVPAIAGDKLDPIAQRREFVRDGFADASAASGNDGDGSRLHTLLHFGLR